MSPKLLVVDDEVNMLRLFKKALGREGYEVQVAGTGAEALRLLREGPFDLIISDLFMPVLDGFSLLREVRIQYPDIPFVVITGQGSIKSAVEAIKGGAFDYLTKPFQKEEILLIIQKALKYGQLQNEINRLKEELHIRQGLSPIIYKSKAMENVLNLVGKVADSQATVLVQGESGTGKELVARAIHELSGRKNGPFVAVDCSVLPDPLLQSELFGHVKGAFTGAAKDKKGLFAAAAGGTLFLDEIGNISPSVQLNLLRVLQEKEIKPVGSVTSIKADVRVVAATNVDLEQSLKQGSFRKDLYYRLAVVSVMVPPLRSRPEDIPPLAYFFMEKYSKLYQRPVTEISPGALRHLMEKSWSGNVRELENVMERAILLNTGPILDESAVYLQENKREFSEEAPRSSLKMTRKEMTSRVEKDALLAALEKARGNKTRAAQLLGISRSSLYTKMKELVLTDN